MFLSNYVTMKTREVHLTFGRTPGYGFECNMYKSHDKNSNNKDQKPHTCFSCFISSQTKADP